MLQTSVRGLKLEPPDCVHGNVFHSPCSQKYASITMPRVEMWELGAENFHDQFLQACVSSISIVVMLSRVG